jgi:hypothetical protein
MYEVISELSKINVNLQQDTPCDIVGYNTVYHNMNPGMNPNFKQHESTTLNNMNQHESTT